jgi:NADH:ubiquinone oxidoreductase subunit H
LLLIILIFLVKFLILLLIVAYFTLSERKIMALSQRRRGPNSIGFWGVLQPLADGLKLLVKQAFVPFKSNGMFFILAPVLILILATVNFSVPPFYILTGVFLAPGGGGGDD